MMQAEASGAPLVRHLWLHHPDDAEARAVTDQFLLGPDVLVAPVTDPGATEREVYLPAFRRVLRDRRFRRLQMCIETPKGDELDEDRRNLAVLRGLL